MPYFMKTITVSTTQDRQAIDLTESLQKLVAEEKIENGVLVVFVKHTTCALTTVDLDPGTDLDYLKAFDQIAPKLKYNHPHDPSHFNEHLLSSLIGTDLVIPIEQGDLGLGPWQKIVLFEFSGPRTRNLSVSIVKY